MGFNFPRISKEIPKKKGMVVFGVHFVVGMKLFSFGRESRLDQEEMGQVNWEVVVQRVTFQTPAGKRGNAIAPSPLICRNGGRDH